MAESLKIEDSVLLDGDGTTIATLSNKLDRQQFGRFIHLFATSPELLYFLDEWVAAGIDRVKADIRPTVTITGVKRHARDQIYGDLTKWLEEGVEVVALAYGDDTSIDRDNLELIISGKEDRAIQDTDGNVVVRLSKFLKEDVYQDYLNLFIASPFVLQLLETNLDAQMKVLKQGYEDGCNFDPEGAAAYKFEVPEFYQKLSNAIARAKGVNPE